MLRRFLSTSTKSVKNKMNKKKLSTPTQQTQTHHQTTDADQEINVYPPIFAIGTVALLYAYFSPRNKYN